MIRLWILLALLLTPSLSWAAVSLNWTNGTDAVGVTGATIRRCTGVACSPTVALTTVTATNGTAGFYVDNTTVAGTTYGFAVNNFDAAANQSAYTATVYITTASVGRTTLGTWDFNIVNGSDVGTVFDAGYTTRTACKIVSNRFLPTTLGSECHESYNGVATPNDQWAQVTIPVLQGAQLAEIGTFVRLANSPTDTGYNCFADVNGSVKAGIVEYTAQVGVLLASSTTYTWTPGHAIRCEAQGTAIRLYDVTLTGGEVLVLSATDASITSGKTGIYAYVTTGGTLTNVQGDDFVMGGFGAETPPTITTVNATSINASLTFGTTPTSIRVATATVSEIHPIADFPSGDFTYSGPIRNSLTTFITFCPRNSAGVENAAGCLTDSSITVVPVDHGPQTGVLRACPTNGRWLCDDGGVAKYLVGIAGSLDIVDVPTFPSQIVYPSPAYGYFQDIGTLNTPVTNAYQTAIATHKAAGLNLIRIWTENTTHFGSGAQFIAGTAGAIPLTQMPYLMTGTRVDTTSGANVTVGIYDLTQFNNAYFIRLRERVLYALNQGVTPIVMLFAADDAQNGFAEIGNPYYTGNNVNSVNVDTNANANVEEFFTLAGGVAGANITAFQKAYVRRVIDELNDLDGYMYEIANEDNSTGLAWQNAIADDILAYETQGGRQTHIIMQSPYPDSTAGMLANTRYKAIVDRCETAGEYLNDPPASAGTKVIFFDTDHSTTSCGTADVTWPWRSFTRAIYTIALDGRETDAVKALIKTAMSQTYTYATRIHLVGMVPATDTSIFSTGYGLYEPCKEYLAYRSDDGANNIDLSACSASQNFAVEFFNPVTGVATAQASVAGGALRSFNPTGTDASVIYLALAPPPPDVTPPTIFGCTPSGTLPIGTTQVVMQCFTDENATLKFATSPGNSYDAMAFTFDVTGGTTHTTTFTGLTPGTYSRYVRGRDTALNVTTSDVLVGWTIPVQTDVTPPVMSNGQPITSLPAGTISTIISLTLDELALCKFDTIDGPYQTLANPMTTNFPTASAVLSQLTDGSSTTIYVRCEDIAQPVHNTDTASLVITVVVDSVTTDTTPPSTVTDLVATVSGSQAILVWSPATDNDAIAGYQVWSCTGACLTFSLNQSLGNTTTTIVGLPLGNSSFEIFAVDLSNNLSVAPSNVASVDIGAQTDVLPPSTLYRLYVIAGDSTSITLETDQGTDDSGSVTTTIEQCTGLACTDFVPVLSQIGLQFIVTGLNPVTSYRFRAFLSDPSGNRSLADSPIATIETAISGQALIIGTCRCRGIQ